MYSTIHIQVTSDVVCPWCWVGKRHLDIAMDKLSHENYVFQIKWKPFELNSWLPEDGLTFKEYATMKFGAGSMERFTEEKVPFFERGKQLGLKFNFSEDRKVVPTKKCHIVLEYAYRKHKQMLLQEKLFKAYFTDGMDISNDDVLRELLSACGLDSDEGIACLTSKEYLDFYSQEIKTANSKGITGVPFFEISVPRDEQQKARRTTQTFSGAQPVDTIIAVIKRAASVTAKV